MIHMLRVILRCRYLGRIVYVVLKMTMNSLRRIPRGRVAVTAISVGGDRFRQMRLARCDEETVRTGNYTLRVVWRAVYPVCRVKCVPGHLLITASLAS